MVYFIQGEITRLIKIGCTIRCPQLRTPNAKKEERKGQCFRIEELQTGSPDELVVLACVPQWGVKEEYALHKRFAHLRVRGEWFRPEKELLDFVGNPVYHYKMYYILRKLMKQRKSKC